MENYKYAFDNKLQQWTSKPVHDKYSHMMDAFRYVVQGTKELDFFNGFLYDTGSTLSSSDYGDDWTGYW